ncbi:hypothetical protein HDV06_003152 [Boothiomyces sp. JEL0866]|nr:hypothetical protein HDV06_003152 [Boothiomyces sp. JEL0866]
MSLFRDLLLDPLPFFNNFSCAAIPPMDLTETKKEFRIELDVPAFKRDEIDIQLEHNYLIIKGDRSARSDKDSIYHLKERPEQFCKSVVLPGTFDSSNIKAKIVDGVLNIALEKSQMKSNKIPIAHL